MGIVQGAARCKPALHRGRFVRNDLRSQQLGQRLRQRVVALSLRRGNAVLFAVKPCDLMRKARRAQRGRNRRGQLAQRLAVLRGAGRGHAVVHEQ